jgi:hypothetical protein
VPSETDDKKVVSKEAAERIANRRITVRWNNWINKDPAESGTTSEATFRLPTYKPFADNVIKVSDFGDSFPFQNVLFPTQGQDIGQRQEHEKTRQLISEKLEALEKLSAQIKNLETQLLMATADLAKSRELEACTTRVCNEIRLENEKTRHALNEQLLDLRTHLSKLAPHKRFFRLAFGILCFFAISLTANSLWGIRIVEPLWAAAGMFLSSAMLIVIYFGMKDVQGNEYRNR